VNLPMIKAFVYNPNGDIAVVITESLEVIKLAAYFIQIQAMMQQILINRISHHPDRRKPIPANIWWRRFSRCKQRSPIIFTWAAR